MLGIKLLICIAILFITSYIGMELASNLKNREKELIDMVTFLKLVQNEMKYMLNSIPDAFEKSRMNLSSSLKNVIGAIVVDMEKQGMNFMENSIDINIAKLNELSSYDKEIITSTLKALGKGDFESQNNIINNTIDILENQIKEAREKKEKNSKVYKAVGVISGLLIIVIFI